jgi:amidase
VADDFAYASTIETAAAIRDGEVSSTELLEAALDRVARLDGPINAVVRLDEARARAAAKAADDAVASGAELGPLHGVPITVKDSFQTKGLITTSGAPELADFVPTEDAAPVAKYRGAGAVIFAKTNLPIWAGDIQSYNSVYGTTSNPYDIERTPGGSSGGSGASLAAGYSPLELGSDIGGSIRIPSHMSGVAGHKPSYGIVNARGQIPGMPGTLSLADIAVAGPMARTVDDLEMALDLLIGPDEWHATAYSLELPPARHQDVSDFRIGAWWDEESCPIDSDTRAALEATAAALADAGATVDVDARPDISFDKAVLAFEQLLSAAESGSWTVAELDEIAKDSEPQGTLGITYAAMRHRQWLSANERRLQQRAKWHQFFGTWDAILLPVMPTPAIRHDQSRPVSSRTIQVDDTTIPYFSSIRWMGLTGVSYLPATVVRVGTSSDGLPIGVQIAGPFLEDRTTLQLARHVESLMGGFQRPDGF